MTIRNQSVLTWLTRDFVKPHVLGAVGEPNVDSYFFPPFTLDMETAGGQV